MNTRIRLRLKLNIDPTLTREELGPDYTYSKLSWAVHEGVFGLGFGSCIVVIEKGM